METADVTLPTYAQGCRAEERGSRRVAVDVMQGEGWQGNGSWVNGRAVLICALPSLLALTHSLTDVHLGQRGRG